jgi:mannose-6-phosphate isomerase
MNASAPAELVKAPIFFNRNRVYRIYKGGKLFHDFFGDPAEDGNYPEEWIASPVKARNEGPKNEREGLATVQGTEITLASLLRDFPEEMTGGRPFDVLVKALDSAIRLPAQTHPDKAFARTYLKSDYGKTESWLILATRPGAAIYFGFKDGVTLADLERISDQSEHDLDAFLEIMQKIPVKPGDLWLIPAGAMHSIGAGCLLLEIQEPTDFVVAPEHWCVTHRLSKELMYQGLDPQTALKCFNFSLAGQRAIDAGKKVPVVVEKSDTYTREALIRYEDTPCFAVNRHNLRGGKCGLRGPAIYVVTEGNGTLRQGGKGRDLKRGDYFFLPHAAKEVVAETGSDLQIVECLPSKKA